MFNNTKFPYMNTQQLNLDWLLKKIKEVLKFMPIDTGNVGDVLQRKETGAEWEPLGAVSLDINGLQTAAAIADDDELPIYDKSATGNRKATVAAIRAGVSSPVTSVNGQTGAVVLDAADVGLGNVDNVKQYSADNPPPYPVTSVNGQTGAVTIPTGGNVDMVFGTPVNLTVTAPTDTSVPAHTLQGQTAGNGKYLRISGIFRVLDSTNNGWKTLTLTGVTVANPPSEVLVKGVAIRFADSGTVYTNDVACNLRVSTAGVITLDVLVQYSYDSSTYGNFIMLPVVVPLA